MRQIKLAAFLLSLLMVLLPAAALIRGPELAAFFQVSSIWKLLGWVLVGSALCLALLAVLCLDVIMGQSRVVIRADEHGRITHVGGEARQENAHPAPSASQG